MIFTLPSRSNPATHAPACSRRVFILSSIAAPLPGRSVASTQAMKRIDAHVHIWAPKEQSNIYPYAGQLLGAGASNEPPMPGHVDVLLGAMQSAGVDGALIVQPGNHLYDHSYVTSVLRQHKRRLAGCLLADPTPGGGGVAALEQLVQQDGYVAVRFNPYLWPEGEKMTNEVGRAMYKRAGELDAPVGHMPFKGLLNHIEDIQQLCQDYPGTRAIIDHCGFCKCGDLQSAEWQALLGLARFPQVYVKASAFFRVSQQAWPYPDACAALRLLVDTFGADRVMWGSDCPWVLEQCGYPKAWSLLDEWAQDASLPAFSDEERRWLLGGTAMKLFPEAWS